jgi:hypothetical protein
MVRAKHQNYLLLYILHLVNPTACEINIRNVKNGGSFAINSP